MPDNPLPAAQCARLIATNACQDLSENGKQPLASQILFAGKLFRTASGSDEHVQQEELAGDDLPNQEQKAPEPHARVSGKFPR
ncbi:hypothetical protein VTH06DRAFT_5986 [Thermothelomyces fergusii]